LINKYQTESNNNNELIEIAKKITFLKISLMILAIKSMLLSWKKFPRLEVTKERKVFAK